MKKRYRILLWILLALVLGAAAVVWLARDWPRRQVQSALARAFDARVDLGRLEIRDQRTFVLHDLDVRGPRFYPWFESLEADRITVTGSLGGILANRFEEIVLEGITAVVRENAEQPPEQEETASAVVRRLVISDGHLLVRGGGGESRFEVAGEVTGLGTGLGGEVRLRAGQLPLVPLLAILTGPDGTADFADDTPLDLRRPMEHLEIDLRFGRGDAAALLEVRAGGVIPFREPGRDPLSFPAGTMRLVEGSGDGWRFIVDAEAPALASLDMEGRVAADGGEIRVDRVTVETGDPVLLLYSLGLVPEEVSGRGRAVLNLERTAEGGPLCRIDAVAEALTLPLGGGKEGSGEPRQLDSLCPLVLAYEGTLEEDAESGDWLTAGKALLTSSTTGDLKADGSLLFGGGSENMLEAEWNWQGPAIHALRRLAAGFGLNISKNYRLGGSPRAAGRVSGPLGRPVVSGRVDIEGVEFCIEADKDPVCELTVSEGSLTADFWYEDQDDLRFPGLRLRGDLQPVPLDPMPLEVSGSGWIDPSTLQGRFTIQSVAFGDLARISGDGRWNPEADPELTATLRLDDADLPTIRRALLPLAGELLPGYELEADVSGEGDAAYSAVTGWTASGTIDLGEAWFASDDGARAVQGLASSWQVSASAAPDGSLRAESSTTAGGFQLLWGSVFGDFEELQPSIRIAAGLEGEEGTAGRWWAEGALQPLAGVRLSGSLSGGDGADRRFSAGLRVEDLATAFQRCARQPLGDSLPLLERLDAGGSMYAFAEGRLDGDHAVLSGQVRLNSLDLTGADRTIAVKGLELDLPLDLAFGPPAEDGTRLVDGAARSGRMGFNELRLDTLILPQTRTGLVVHGDTVSLEVSQSIPLLGGTVTFHRMTLAHLLGSDRHVVAGLALEGLQLAELSRTLEWPLFEGEVDGLLPRVELSPTSLRVDGGGEISLFGGTVSIRDISGEEVLSRYPRLSFSADFREIDLARLTRTFDFGEITGILEGSVSDCRLFAGTPVGFRAEMRTVPRDGVSQTINVKAINNIAIVGTGGRITIFDRGIHSLLDRYTYEQLGVKMRLEKDMFYLRGTEHRGDRELFLKGRLPFRIDVVNAEPGKTVSFSTMLARFQALEFSQAVTETGGDADVR